MGEETLARAALAGETGFRGGVITIHPKINTIALSHRIVQTRLEIYKHRRDNILVVGAQGRVDANTSTLTCSL